jgi:hypothetical protein
MGRVTRVQKISVFRSPELEAAMSDIYRVLGSLFLGEFRFVYSETHSKLFLQVAGSSGFTTVAGLDKSGNLEIAGTLTQGVTFPVIGG